MRYRCDRSYERHDHLILGGSPLRVIRVAPAGIALLTRIESGDDIAASPGERALISRLEDVGLIHPVPEVADSAIPLGIPILTPVHRLGPVSPRTVPGAVVIDDASVPPLTDARVRLATNRGPGAARNAGLAHLRSLGEVSDFVIFLDADVDPGPDPEWYLPLVALCARDPRCAVVAPRVASPRGTSLRERYEHSHSPLDLGGEPGRVQPGTRISYLPSTALVCRVAALEEVGGFAEDLRYGEDVDLIWRLLAAGWTCRYHPGVVVHHPPRSTWAAWCTQRVGYGSSAAALAARHGSAVSPAHMHPLSWTTWALVLTGHPIAAAITILGSIHALARKVPDLGYEVAGRLVALGTALSGAGLLRAVRRAWWPALIPIAIVSRRARALALMVVCLPYPTALSIPDDLVYGYGVWKGIFRQRTARSLWAIWPRRSHRGGPKATVPA